MMILYSNASDIFSHRCRIVLHEKSMDFQIKDVSLPNNQEDLGLLSPNAQAPVLVDRDLKLHEPNIICEYIDERFPHPQLMPADPMQRARVRQLLYQLHHELFRHIPQLEQEEDKKKLEKARTYVRDRLTEIAPMTQHGQFLLDSYSILDVTLMPLLWRLPHYGITLGRSASTLLVYAERMFSREGFTEALTPMERAMR